MGQGGESSFLCSLDRKNKTFQKFITLSWYIWVASRNTHFPTILLSFLSASLCSIEVIIYIHKMTLTWNFLRCYQPHALLWTALIAHLQEFAIWSLQSAIPELPQCSSCALEQNPSPNEEIAQRRLSPVEVHSVHQLFCKNRDEKVHKRAMCLKLRLRKVGR